VSSFIGRPKLAARCLLMSKHSGLFDWIELVVGSLSDQENLQGFVSGLQGGDSVV
jgi:hypothetical protein